MKSILGVPIVRCWTLGLLSWAAASAAENQGLVDLENARASLANESKALKSEHEAKLKELREKHRQSAEKGKAGATKNGDFDLAVAWEKLIKELGGGAIEEAPEPPPREVERARSDYRKEAYDLEGDLKRKLRAHRERHRKAAEERKTAETKKGNLELAAAWEEFRKELDPGLANLAPAAQVKVSAELPEHLKANLTDGVTILKVDAHKYWYAARDSGRQWAAFDLGGSKVIRKVRFLVPVATRWHRTGHEPLDYEVLFKLGGKVKDRVTVREGRHPKKEPVAKGVQWVEISPRSETEASEVEFSCTRTSGRNLAPIIFEFEILGGE